MILQANTATLPRVLEALATHTDSENGRYALGTIKVEAKDNFGLAVATDGRRLAVVRFPSQTEGELDVLIETKDLQNACRSAKPKASAAIGRPDLRNVQLRTVGETMFARASDGESEASISMKKTEGRFPNWRAILLEDRHTSGITVALDARFLKEAAELLERVGITQDSRALFVTVRDPKSAVYLSTRNAETGTTCEVVIMPLATASNHIPFVSKTA